MPLTYSVQAGASTTYYPAPIVFTPSMLPGFIDYSATYSQFRIVKASCKVHLAVDDDEAVGASLANQPYTYLRVSSRSFLESSAYTAFTASAEAIPGGDPYPAGNFIASQRYTVSDLRQSRWQKQYYPSDIKNAISFKFRPYTLEWQGRPIGGLTSVENPAPIMGMMIPKYRSARQWMPFSFLGFKTNPTSTDDVTFLGPYFTRLLSTGNDAQSLSNFHPAVTLTVWFQFRGQK